jgi:ketosteroid isomerase-like protein
MDLDENKKAAIASFRLIESGDAGLAARLIATDFVNREAEDDPDQPERTQAGPAGFLATGRWLREAFDELRFEDIEALAEGERVAVIATMTGRHTGPFQGMAPTGKPFRQRQIHLFRLRGGKIVEHLAQRDDLGLLLQLGWRPTLAGPAGAN